MGCANSTEVSSQQQQQQKHLSNAARRSDDSPQLQPHGKTALPFHPDPTLEDFDALLAAGPANPLAVPGTGGTATVTHDDATNADDELSRAWECRLPSRAFSIDELPGNMHLQRMQGRGNMARMHGYTADVDQFPAPPHPLTAEQQHALDTACLAWADDVAAAAPFASSRESAPLDEPNADNTAATQTQTLEPSSIR